MRHTHHVCHSISVSDGRSDTGPGAGSGGPRCQEQAGMERSVRVDLWVPRSLRGKIKDSKSGLAP